MMIDGARRLMEREHLKPKNLSATLARFASYFRNYWYALVIVALFMGLSTWVQVTAAEIPGQAVDCYLYQTPASNCTFSARDAKAIDSDQTLDATAKYNEKVAGLL